ncbi:MAG TPA: methyltransferase domain-containing protein [Gammaproteobacteria bacterium]|nr:methyltransferase domain-containing protein [Gammaproteobacteria bacterium]
MTDFKHRNDCRLCGAVNLELVLPILPSPIGDAFVPKQKIGEVQNLYPLDTYICLECGHLQNLDVVDPEILFRNYTYRTSVSLGLVKHFQKYAEAVVNELGIQKNSLVVEIGSNDGSLLKAYKALGMRVIGIDPAKTIAELATAEGVRTLPDFFSFSIAKKILAENGIVQVICANNVFAHADNINDIVKGIRMLLAPNGVFVFEVSYMPDIIDNFVFDTIYHEHVSYHALIPLERFFNRLDMSLFNVVRVATKGGSIRGFAQPMSTGKHKKTGCLKKMLDEENRRCISHPEIYRAFYQDIEKQKRIVLEYLDYAIAGGKTVGAYGASTTTTTLLYHFELQKRIQLIVDDNPLKQNLYSPGEHIPVYSSSVLYSTPPDIILILAWQYSTAIMKKHECYMKNGGKFVVPLPNLKVFPQKC